MSVLLGLAFAAMGVLAAVAIAACLGRYAPSLGPLHRALRQPAPIEELRVTLREQIVASSPSKPSPLRRKRQARPVKHRNRHRNTPSAAA